MIPSLVLALCLPQGSPAAAAKTEIITFGTNAPEWTHKLMPSGVRMGCNLAPPVCLARAEKNASREGVAKVYLAIELDPANAAEYAGEYGRLSRAQPLLYEIGIDDFASTYYHLFQGQKTADPAGLVSTVIANAKKANPDLKFGVTLYETDLDSAYLRDDRLPAAVRARVDIVHLYIHHRANGSRYAKYVQQAERLFPRASVIAGSYPYDRIDYIACKKGGSRDCSVVKEMSYFKEALNIQLRLLRDGSVAGIEFYPAEFGREDEWYGWNKPEFCKPERKQECIANTKAMRRFLLESLDADRAPARGANN